MREAAEKQGRTVLYVSHNMNTIRQLCQRCVVLDKGKIVFEGDVENAISTYLGTNEELLEKTIKFDPYKRAGFLKNDYQIILDTFELLDHEDYCYKLNDVFRFKLTWEALNNIENLSLRIKLVSSNGSPAINYYLESFMDVKSGEKYCKSFEIDLSDLMYGKYSATFVFSYSVIEGRSQLVEAMLDSINFEIEKEETDQYWPSKYWGYVKSEKIKVIDN